MENLILFLPFLAAGIIAMPQPTVRKHGGLWFWRIGRLGGSVYIARH